jgi:5-aminopentanamidase
MTNYSLRVAAVQLASVKGDVEANLEAMSKKAHEAAAQGAGVLVFPELCVTGYDVGPSFATLAETRNGRIFERLSALARNLKLAICFGYPEREGELIYNAAQLIDDEGRAIINHRKSHLFGAYEREWFSRGDVSNSQADYRNFRLSVLICYEVEFPELVRSNAIEGANVFLVPTAVMETTGPEQVTQLLVRARAAENNVYVVYANHIAEEGVIGFNGNSLIAGPFGRILALAGGQAEELILADIHSSQIADSTLVLPYLEDFRQELFYEKSNLKQKTPGPL